MEKRFFLVDNLAFSVDNPVDKCITMCEIAGVEHFFYFSRVFGEFRQSNERYDSEFVVPYIYIRLH